MKKLFVTLSLLSVSSLWAIEFPFVSASGFVDGAYFHDGNANPDSGQFDGFSLDQVEVDLQKPLGEHGFVRADVEYVNGADPQNAIDYIEQGYMQYSFPINDKSLEVMFGKFNAPIGFESIDPVSMYQYSHSEVFTYGSPTNLTGLKGHMEFTDQFDLHAYVVNGWDNNTENNDGLTFGGRLGVKSKDGVSVGLSAISGTEGQRAKKRTALDADITVTAIDGWIFGGEFNLGMEEEAAQNPNPTPSLLNAYLDAKWTGFLVMGHYDFTNTFGLTGRFGSFSDQYGIRTSIPQSNDLSYSSITIAPTVKLGEGMGCLLELRFDSANEQVWLDSDGKATDSRTTAAFEVTYSF